MVESAPSVQWGQQLGSPWSCSCAGRKTADPGEAAIFLAFQIFPGNLLKQRSAGGVVCMKWRPCWLCRQNRARGQIFNLSLLAGLMTIGFQYLLSSPFPHEVALWLWWEAAVQGLEKGPESMVESRSGVLLPSPPSILLSTRDLCRFETVPSHTAGKCICMFGFNGRERPWDFTPSLKCQSSHCF